MKRDAEMLARINKYFYESWIQTAGEGWTKKQVAVSYAFSVVFALAVVFYSQFAGLEWSWIQKLAAGLIAWDLGGGVLGYNHRAIKLRQAKEKNNLHYFHHNLQHIHPLMLIFFNNQLILFILTVYWFLTFMLYVEFLEISVQTGQRKIGRSGEIAAVILEVVVALFLIVASYYAKGINSDYRIYGILLYGSLAVMTCVLIKIPVAFQRTASIMMVVIMVVLGMYTFVPQGFEWLIPVYYLKLLTGFTAKE